MPVDPIIDSHVHLWDPRLIRYPWLDGKSLLNRSYLVEDYCAATQSVPVSAMIFVQCEADFSEFERETTWASEQARLESRIEGLVAWAPLEKGRAVRADLERLKQHGRLRGIRRVIQFEPDPDFCLRPLFIEGIRTLREFDLSFDICVDHRRMDNVLQLVERIPDVRLVLDHIGKPAIKDGLMQPWAQQIYELARFPHVCCKISGVATEADQRLWKPEQLVPYIEIAIDAFGFDRILFGSDWPVSTQAIRYEQWTNLLDNILAGVDAGDQRKFWSGNAARFYRICDALA
jgi:L-fuconolactonase